MTSDSKPGELAPTEGGVNVPKVQRSAVPAGKDYQHYRNYLRYDFYYACAYCQISEAEAASIKFTIDHYEPQAARPELTHEYSNLMYSCERCNVLKGTRCPSHELREKGFRIYRMDADVWSEHFTINGIRVEHVSNTGLYTIEALDLNRQALRRLRDMRRRLADCDTLVAEGLLGLKHFHIDRLPRTVRGQVLSAIRDANGLVTDFSKTVDSFLRENMRSPLVDDDPEFETRSKERSKALRDLQVITPENWHAGRKDKEAPSKPSGHKKS